MDPPRHMAWSWRNDNEATTTTVTISLEAVDGGTLLRLRHIGEFSPSNADDLGSGWPTRLDMLETALTDR